MANKKVDTQGLRASINKIGKELRGYDGGNYSILDFGQDNICIVIQADSAQICKDFMIAVLHALGDNLELSDKSKHSRGE